MNVTKKFQRTSEVAQPSLLPYLWQSVTVTSAASHRHFCLYGPRLPTPNRYRSWNSAAQLCLQMEKQRNLPPRNWPRGSEHLSPTPPPPGLRLQWNTPKCLLWNPLQIPFGVCTMLRVPPWHTAQHLHRELSSGTKCTSADVGNHAPGEQGSCSA